MAGVIGAGRFTPPIASASPPSLPVEIAARHAIEPYRQGELDGLCSIYSAINALRLALHGVAPLSNSRAKELFEQGAVYLERKDGLSDTVASGTSTRRWHGIVRRLARHVSTATIAVELEQPGLGSKPTSDETIAWIEASIGQGKPVLIHLEGGSIDHFSIVAGLTLTRLQLFDSGPQRFLKRASCIGPKSYYRIPPKALLRIAVSRRG